MNETEKNKIRAALQKGRPMTTEELMAEADLVGNLALFRDIVEEEQRDGRMRRVPEQPFYWEQC